MDNILSQSVVLNKTVKMISYYSPITVFLIFSVILFIVFFNRKRARMVKLIDKIPGPAALPILGNSIEMNVDHDGEYFRFSSIIISFSRSRSMNYIFLFGLLINNFAFLFHFVHYFVFLFLCILRFLSFN